MSHPVTHKDLEMLRLIASTGSLTATAQQLSLSQPAISQRLAALRDRLGTELFARRGGRMHATPAALRLAEAALAVDRILEQALDDLHGMLEQRQRRLRITTQCHTSYRWLSFVIRDLLAAHPELSVDVVPEAVEDPFGAITRDEVDAALVFLPGEAGGAHEAELFSDEMYAVMQSGHPLAKRRFLNPQDFAGEALVLFTGKRHAFIDQVLSPAGVTPGRLRQVWLTEAIVELARAGQGIAILAGWVLNDIASREGLATVRIFRGGHRRTWRALYGEQCPEAIAHTFTSSVRRLAGVIASDGWRSKLEINSHG